jgi:hypothetical protein
MILNFQIKGKLAPKQDMSFRSINSALFNSQTPSGDTTGKGSDVDDSWLDEASPASSKEPQLFIALSSPLNLASEYLRTILASDTEVPFVFTKDKMAGSTVGEEPAGGDDDNFSINF